MTDLELFREILLQVMEVPDRCVERIERDEDGEILCKYTCAFEPVSCLGAQFKDYEISYALLDWIRKLEIEEEGM